VKGVLSQAADRAALPLVYAQPASAEVGAFAGFFAAHGTSCQSLLFLA
jgi:hypothetical protein